MNADDMKNRVRVELGARSYDVSIGALSPDAIADKLAAALDPKTTGVAVLVDANVAEKSARARDLVTALAARLPHVERLDLRPGEACKNLTEIEKSCEWLAAHAYDRRAAIVGIGGGAATDHAGFAAAVYLRGVPFALVPTTLLAMVDASVGGKTGVDLGAGKNLVGAFHQPRAVVADVGFLETLPERERVAGLAEVVKCGFIADAGLLDLLEQSGPALTVAQHEEIITRAVNVKADVVASDENESGRRAILNFGHTVGHALEAASGYGLLHGEAVALGMVAALDLGTALAVGPPALAARARNLLARLGLPIDYERRFDAQAQAGITVDKKRRGSTIRFVLVPTPGETQFMELSPADIASHLAGRAAAKA
ncbi:MAG TPA: 3-dehydroquinate synthase [Polyangia bacterium]|jgi:3-dehydroquinate synthase|nr:3-dehydroquinate synthase [Polyangia bacterium]